jgi:hypothetical protein
MNRTSLVTAASLMLIAAVAPLKAQEPPPGVDLSALGGICNDVYQKFRADAGGPYRYEYERKVFTAAGVSPEEAEEAMRQSRAGIPADSIAAYERIREMWSYALSQRYALDRPRLECSTPNFDVPRGYILKYAIKMGNYDFLVVAVELWGVDLNVIDRSDGRTLLDYLEKEMERTRGSHTEAILREYSRILRARGARRASELR